MIYCFLILCKKYINKWYERKIITSRIKAFTATSTGGESLIGTIGLIGVKITKIIHKGM